MGLDIDYVFAKKALENIESIVGDIDHGEREEIADDILKFEKAICKKYGAKSAFKENANDKENSQTLPYLLVAISISAMR